MKLEHRQGMQRYCEMTRADLMGYMDYYTVRESDGGVLGFLKHRSGEAKILAIAHVDYLATGKVSANNRKRIVSSALDDRAGVYIAMEMLDDYGIVADVLLTDFEERGRSTIASLGAGMLDKYNWIIQLDRRGDDVVTYGYTELKEKLSEFWKVERGMRTCIQYIEEVCPVSAFNVGIGYYGEHYDSCYLSYKVLHRQMGRLKGFYDKYVNVALVRDHQHTEIRDAVKPLPVWKQKDYKKPKKLPLPAQKKLVTVMPHGEKWDTCDWCCCVAKVTVRTPWNSLVCTNCWNDYEIMRGSARKDIVCDECFETVPIYEEVDGVPYCLECAPVMKAMSAALKND